MALPEGPLHQDRIHPAAELEADGIEPADLAKALAAVQAYRAGVGAVTDDGQHLSPRTVLAALDQGRQQFPADPVARKAVADINRVLDRVTIGRARTVGGGIAVAHDAAVHLGHQIGQAELQHGLAAADHLGDAGGSFLEARQSVQHMVRIDFLHEAHVAFAGVANIDGRSHHRSS